MPTKRRRQSRTARQDEVKAWRPMFSWGYDFFNDLGPFGLPTEAEARAAAPGAWRRLGKEFLRAWEPTEPRDKPWALEEFGEP